MLQCGAIQCVELHFTRPVINPTQVCHDPFRFDPCCSMVALLVRSGTILRPRIATCRRIGGQVFRKMALWYGGSHTPGDCPMLTETPSPLVLAHIPRGVAFYSVRSPAAWTGRAWCSIRHTTVSLLSRNAIRMKALP